MLRPGPHRRGRRRGRRWGGEELGRGAAGHQRGRPCGDGRGRAGACRVVPREEAGESGRRLTPPGRRGGGLAAPDPDRAELRKVGPAPEIGGGQGDPHAGPVLAGPLGDRGAQHQTAAAVALPVREAVGRHPDGAGHAVLQLQLRLAGAVEGQDRADRGPDVRRRRVGGGAGEPVGGNLRLVLRHEQGFLQLGQAVVEPRQAFVDETGQFQPRVDRGTAVLRVVALTRGRYRAERPDLLDPAHHAVPAPPRRLARVLEPLGLVPQALGCVRAERSGPRLHPGLGDAQPGGAQHPRPQRTRVDGAGQSRHPYPAVGRYPAPRQAAADRALCVHHDRVEGRFPALRRSSRHVLRTPAVFMPNAAYAGALLASAVRPEEGVIGKGGGAESRSSPVVRRGLVRDRAGN